jgi:hypothetical protein
MEEVIHYLEMKNHYYEKFQSITEKFLVLANQDQWDGIEFFVDNRERILNIIRSFDFKIAEAFDRIDFAMFNPVVYRSRVKELLDRRAALGNKIIALDLELIAKMEETKSETIRELKKTLETNQQLQSFEAQALPRKSKAQRGA